MKYEADQFNMKSFYQINDCVKNEITKIDLEETAVSCSSLYNTFQPNLHFIQSCIVLFCLYLIYSARSPGKRWPTDLAD